MVYIYPNQSPEADCPQLDMADMQNLQCKISIFERLAEDPR
jgi:hypothetical protein